jgi:hypothetical protein
MNKSLNDSNSHSNHDHYHSAMMRNPSDKSQSLSVMEIPISHKPFYERNKKGIYLGDLKLDPSKVKNITFKAGRFERSKQFRTNNTSTGGAIEITNSYNDANVTSRK